WHPLERQVRVEGTVEVVSAAESDEYYAVRPLGSRLGAWASPQSAVIPGRTFLEREHAELTARYSDGNVPRPPNCASSRGAPRVGRRGRPRRRPTLPRGRPCPAARPGPTGAGAARPPPPRRPSARPPARFLRYGPWFGVTSSAYRAGPSRPR